MRVLLNQKNEKHLILRMLQLNLSVLNLEPQSKTRTQRITEKTIKVLIFSVTLCALCTLCGSRFSALFSQAEASY
ncbi:hypothetical protein CSQ88_02730 [Iodobacter sp. BJB302]|nr:hypothetical protein CSQ88_02730 [Iodobacter sp. BJB302]